MPKIKDLPLIADVDGSEDIILEKGDTTGRSTLFGYMRQLGFTLSNVVRARMTMSKPGDPMFALRYPDDSLLPIIDADGYPLVHRPGGPEPVAHRGRIAMSPGVIDGEALVEFTCDADGNVTGGTGSMGGEFKWIGDRFVRTNANAFQAQPARTVYEGQDWTNPQQQELLARPAGAMTAYILLGAGQSLFDGENQNLDDALISAVPVYPDQALMLQGGPRLATISEEAVLVPLAENITNQGNGVDRQQETPLSGWATHFIRDYHDAFGQFPTVLGMSMAVGGHPYLAVKKGTPAFRNLSEGLQLAFDALRARGFTDIRVAVGWVWGESDTGLDRMTQSRAMKQAHQFRRDVGDIIRRITGEVAEPLMIMTQTSFMKPGTSPWDQPVRQAVVELDKEPGFVLAGPVYQHAMTGSENPADYHIHPGNLGKYSIGQQLARAHIAEELGATWHGPRALAASWAATPGGPCQIFGTRIIIDCDSMGAALVLDISETKVKLAGLADYGLLFDDASGAPPAITDVSVTGQQIIVDLAWKPAGPNCRIGYALKRNADQWDADGPVLGARGCIRDDQASIRICDGVAQHNWLPAFILTLPKP
ncbi:hypothetical protein [Sphingobium yanoikuyae]|uniref:hypothetical protein n=1 Tax=Sphingobium yanoikuyae TaxID=13690 RepID=UPI0028A704E9|nr:hypothetical protein [Sphingobium yanoikuyae]